MFIMPIVYSDISHGNEEMHLKDCNIIVIKLVFYSFVTSENNLFRTLTKKITSQKVTFINTDKYIIINYIDS